MNRQKRDTFDDTGTDSLGVNTFAFVMERLNNGEHPFRALDRRVDGDI